ncbi:hypothetical protein BJV82DRAFT_704693 [Fennellomyces sp. T-0311]|nr:hypothetical protein BJV82DRAFT_704693 [Fennellomyces sp. T-0311]
MLDVTTTESDDELIDIEQNTGSSNDHETVDEDMRSVNSEDNPNVREEVNIDEDFCEAVESEELDADVEWMRSHSDQDDIRNDVYDAEMVKDHYEESDEEEDKGEDEDVNGNPDAAPKDSPISKYLSQIQADLREQEYLEVYKNGGFWILPPMPFFALKKKLDPTTCYLPRVFLWIPHILVHKRLSCPECKVNLRTKGYNKTPYARHVIDLTRYFYS